MLAFEVRNLRSKYYYKKGFAYKSDTDEVVKEPIQFGDKTIKIPSLIYYLVNEYTRRTVYHKDGNKHNNLIENLTTDYTESEKFENMPGVSFVKSSGKWQARSTFEGAYVYLGIHATQIEAYEAYLKYKENPYPPESLRRLGSLMPITFAQYNKEKMTEDEFVKLSLKLQKKAIALAEKRKNKESREDIILLSQEDIVKEVDKLFNRYQKIDEVLDFRHTGVKFDKSSKMWRAESSIDGAYKRLGQYSTKDEAIKAYLSHAVTRVKIYKKLLFLYKNLEEQM